MGISYQIGKNHQKTLQRVDGRNQLRLQGYYFTSPLIACDPGSNLTTDNRQSVKNEIENTIESEKTQVVYNRLQSFTATSTPVIS